MSNLSLLIEDYCAQLRRRQIHGSFVCAKRTAEIMRLLITTQRHSDAASLIEDVRTVGTKLQAANPIEFAIGNMVRRVLHMIREEAQVEEAEAAAHHTPADKALAQDLSKPGLLSLTFRGGAPQRHFNRNASLCNLLDQGSGSLEEGPSPLTAQPGMRLGGGTAPRAPLPPPSPTMASGTAPSGGDVGMDSALKKSVPAKRSAQWRHKQAVIDELNELIDELDGIDAQIAAQAVEHIHANESILTFGSSETTLRFLKEAHKRRSFQVVVAEAAPRYDGHSIARSLAEAGVPTTLIADSAVFAMMARVNKVLVGAHAVLADGGVIAPSGVHLVALAAHRHSVPFVVLVGLHKVSPLFPQGPGTTFNDFKSPSALADADVVAAAFARQAEAAAAASADGGNGVTVEVHNPAYDYIPPHLVSLLVTDTGGYTPSYVYRLLAEYYSRDDYVLSKELLNMLAH